MKKLKFSCPHCEAKLRVPTHLAGVSAPCPKCGEMITAPSDITAAVAESAGLRRAPAAGPAPVRNRAEPPAPLGAAPGPAPVKPSVAFMDSPTATSTLLREPVNAELPEPSPRPAHVVPASSIPEVLPVPVPAETRVDLAPASPARARSENVPPPTAPAFFSPPPPIRSLTPPDPGEDEERSAPPVLLEAANELVVEEHFFEEGPTPPPLSATITQPIQVSTARGDISRSAEPLQGGQTLPRLDVSLGGEGRASSVSAPAEAGSPGLTRVFLPVPGSEALPSSPEDFLTPPTPGRTVPDPRSTDGLDSCNEGMSPIPEVFPIPSGETVPVPTPTYTAIPIPSEQGAIPLDELEDEKEWESGTNDGFEPGFALSEAFDLPPTFPEAPSLASPEAADEVIGDHPAAPDPSGQWPETGTSSVPLNGVLSNPVSRSQQSSQPEVFDEVPADPLEEGTIANLFAPKAPLPEAGIPSDPSVSFPTKEREPESLFDIRRPAALEEKGVSRTMIVMIASIVVVAIIAAVGVVLVINSFLGGFSPAEAYNGPDAQVAPVEPKGSVAKPRIPTSSSTASAPDLSISDSPAVIDPPARPREGAATSTGTDAPALSFDEKVQQMVNGRGGSVIGSPGLDIMEKPVTDFSGNPETAKPASVVQTPPAAGLPAAVAAAPASAVAAVSGAPGAGAATPPASPANAPAGAKVANYNPLDSFAAPGPGDSSSLGKTHDLIDAFLRAPDVATRMKYTFQGESLRAAVEDYHKKWPYGRFDRYSLQLYQMELDPSIGGPYWVFIVSTSDGSEGFPFIVRTENGLLKADWEIFAEFSDRQFLRFRDGKMAPPATFRLILERFTDYYGSDRDAFTDLGSYLVYQVYPPYGETEFSEFVFVKKDSELGKKLDKLVGIGDEPLAVVATLDQQAFAHGVKHYVLTELVTEGWFR